MRQYHLQRNRKHCPTVNVEKLWSMVPAEVREKYAKDTSKVPVLDVGNKGFFKVLGKGKFYKQPLIVKAKYFSRTAEAKIVAAGGVCILTA